MTLPTRDPNPPEPMPGGDADEAWCQMARDAIHELAAAILAHLVEDMGAELGWTDHNSWFLQIRTGLEFATPPHHRAQLAHAYGVIDMTREQFAEAWAEREAEARFAERGR